VGDIRDKKHVSWFLNKCLMRTSQLQAVLLVVGLVLVLPSTSNAARPNFSAASEQADSLGDAHSSSRQLLGKDRSYKEEQHVPLWASKVQREECNFVMRPLIAPFHSTS